VNSVTSAAEQRRLADVLLKPPLANVDLLHWHAFDRAIEAGYTYARSVLESLRDIPRLPAAADRPQRSSLTAELERRLGVRETGSGQDARPIRVPPG
jgi:predicted acylesterase/phospholipase RssA